MKPKPVHVYSLHDGLSNYPFYVGISSDPRGRLSAHRAACDGRRQDSLTGCGVKSKDLSMRLLATCDERHTAELIEKCLQEHYDIVVVDRKQLYRGKPDGQS